VWALAWGGSQDVDRTIRFTLPLAETADTSSLLGGRVAGARNPNNLLALSPDGGLLAYVARDSDGRSLFLRPLDRLETERLAVDDGVRSPFFSPDGEWLGFLTDEAVMRLRLTTREVETVATGLPDVSWIGAAWGEDGRIGNPNAVFGFAEAQGSGAERIQGGVWIGSNTPPAWRQGTGAMAG
jgi:hypothetical protein